MLRYFVVLTARDDVRLKEVVVASGLPAVGTLQSVLILET